MAACGPWRAGGYLRLRASKRWPHIRVSTVHDQWRSGQGGEAPPERRLRTGPHPDSPPVSTGACAHRPRSPRWPESRGDRHVLVAQAQKCRLYEMYAAYPQRHGASWKAGSGALWSLRSNALRPAGWTSADAAGLPILPLLVRYEDVAAGTIKH